MKIGILTHPLINNYGGILQNYALQYVLRQLGHDAITIDINIKHRLPVMRLLAGWCNRLRRYYIKGERVPLALDPKPNALQLEMINHNTRDFVNKNIAKTEIVEHYEDLSKIDAKYNFGAYVVGSDQVWNTGLCPWYFGSFINRENVKLISYAASFGYDQWKMDSSLTEVCSALAKKFFAISVREESAVELCRNFLDVEAKHVIDPTLLLSKEAYLRIIKIQKEDSTLFSYILDKSDYKSRIVNCISLSKNLVVRECMPEEEFLRGTSKIERCVFPTVDQWLNGFNNADFVITDSFHGTVFSILFNVPFIAIGNKRRGLTRFKSLLKMFGLENRLVNNIDEAMDIADQPIDFENVNRILESERRKAFEFLEVLS